jgi:hypothetical protein
MYIITAHELNFSQFELFSNVIFTVNAAFMPTAFSVLTPMLAAGGGWNSGSSDSAPGGSRY